MFYIGIDLGTSSVKLLLMDSQGRTINTVSREYEISFPEAGWSEQNPEDWYRETIEGMQELTEKADKSQVAGISFGGQMHGLVILDENDEVIRPCILWNDGRTKKECDYLNRGIGTSVLLRDTANIAFAGFTAPKLLWLKKNEPENFGRIKKIMLPKDYLAYQLTGVFSTDVSDASGTLLFDVKNRCWSEKMCEICGISEEMLPKVSESYECIGTITKAAAQSLGFSENVKAAAGAGDNAAAAVAAGAVGNGECNISLGTSGTVFLSSDKFCADKNNALHSFCDSSGRYHLLGCMLSAASCNKWWIEDILETCRYTKEQERIEKLGENQVYFLPYLMGERSPHNNPNARGTFIGMSMNTRREDMTQAVLEGVAFAFQDMLQIAHSLDIYPERTRICGGGAKSEYWIRILANVLNLKVDIMENEEGPSFGAAILAAVACGEYRNVEEAVKKLTRAVRTVEPEAKLAEKYKKQYEKFRQIYPACKEIFDVLYEEV